MSAETIPAIGQIEIENNGPVHHMVVPWPLRGGVVRLSGAPGSGKSTTIGALSQFFGGSGRAIPSDGKKAAKITGFGVTLTVGLRSTRRGELEVIGMDGADPSILVNPRTLGENSRERERITALCRLARADVDLEKAGRLVGGLDELKRLLEADTFEHTDDVVEFMARVKRDLEHRARDEESEQTKAQMAAHGLRASLEAIDPIPAGLPSLTEARDAHEAALRELAETEGARESAVKLADSHARWKAALESLGERGTAAAIEAADREAKVADDLMARAGQEWEKADAKVRQIEIDLANARGELAQAKARHETRIQAHRHAVGVQSAQRADAMQRAEHEKALEAAAPSTPISDEWLTELRGIVAQKRAISEAAAGAEKTREKIAATKERIEEHRKVANQHGERAQILRNAAADTEVLLTEACSEVCGEELKIEGGRLMALHPVRGWIPFEELSTGEAYGHAIPIAAKSVRKWANEVGMPAALIMGQEPWQALGPELEETIKALAEREGVTILVAQVDRGELRAEIL